METEPLFLLVHGTWAPGAPWARRDGALASRLLQEFPGASVASVDWTGANTFSARMAAARQIVGCASSGGQTQRPLILVGHSHGGSSIMYALRQEEAFAARVAGAVFLGTPFFALVPRAGYRQFFRAGVLLLLSAAFVALAFVLGYYANPRPWSVAPVREMAFLALSGVVFVGAVYVGRQLMLRTTWLDRAWEKGRDTAEALSTVRTPPVPTLFLRTTGDEVALVLATLQVAALASNLASGVFAAAMGLLVRAATRAWARRWSRVTFVILAMSLVIASTLCGALVALFGASAFTIGDVLNPFSSLWNFEPSGLAVVDKPLEFLYRSALCIDLVLACVLALLSTLLVFFLVAAWTLSTATYFAFGKFAPIEALMLEMAAEPTPRGSHQFVHLPWEERIERRRSVTFGLRHSAPYGDAAAIDVVVQWVRASLACHESSTESAKGKGQR